MGKQINEFIRNLTGEQLEKLMEIMTDYDLSVTDAVVFGYDEIKGVL